jgi:hypothetical protein
MTRNPRRLVIIAVICAVLSFLLGAPELVEGTGTVQTVAIGLQLIVTGLGLAALALAGVGYTIRRRSAR